MAHSARTLDGSTALHDQTARNFNSVRWIGPTGSVTAAFTLLWLLNGLVSPVRLYAWLLSMTIVCVVIASAITVPQLRSWKSKRKLPVLTEVGHALMGISCGSAAFIDSAALANDRVVQLSVISFVFAMSLGLAWGTPRMSSLAMLALIPMWLGVIVGFALAGVFVMVAALSSCAGFIAFGNRQDRQLWAEVLKLRAAAKDEADRRRFEAHNDSLTGLLSRAGSDAEVANLLTESTEEQAFAVLYIDLDRFKPINDMYGHASGDEVLAEVGSRLSSVCRQSDVIARIGGDEFMVVSQTEPDEKCGLRLY